MSEFRDICKNRLIYQEWLSSEFAKKGIHWVKKRMGEHHFSTFMLSHCCILFATQLIKDYWSLFWLKEVAALLIFDDLRSEGNRSLFKTENIINFSKDLDVHDGHRSSAANFIKCTDHRFTEKFFCSLKLMSSRRSILERFMQCWLNQKESVLC